MKSGYPKLHRLETPWELDCLIVVFLMTLFCFVLGNSEMSITWFSFHFLQKEVLSYLFSVQRPFFSFLCANISFIY